MFTRAGFNVQDARPVAVAWLGAHVAQLARFVSTGDYAWYYPRFDCWRWAGFARARSLIVTPDGCPGQWERPQCQVKVRG